MPEQERFIDRREAAEFLDRELGLKITRLGLQKLASKGGGPTYRVFGNRAVYLPSELRKWALEEKLSPPRTSTSGVV